MAANYHERVASGGGCYADCAWVEQAVGNGDGSSGNTGGTLGFSDKAAETGIARTGDGALKYAAYDID